MPNQESQTPATRSHWLRRLARLLALLLAVSLVTFALLV